MCAPDVLRMDLLHTIADPEIVSILHPLPPKKGEKKRKKTHLPKHSFSTSFPKLCQFRKWRLKQQEESITLLFHSRLSVSNKLIGSPGRYFFFFKFSFSCRLLHLPAKLQRWWARLGPVPKSVFWLAWESWAKRHKRTEDFKNIPPRRVNSLRLHIIILSLRWTRSVGLSCEESGFDWLLELAEGRLWTEHWIKLETWLFKKKSCLC